MTTKERIKEFLKYKKIGRNVFEEKIGVSMGYISTKSKTVTSDVIEKTYALYPSLNLEWLLTGEGQMLKEETIINPSNNLINESEMIKKIERLEKMVDYLLKTNERQKEEIEALRGQLS